MDTDSTRQRILRAAVQSFAEKGFEGASMREILREAGANAALGHYHFGSKRDLYQAVIESNIAPLCQQRLTALAAIDPALDERARVAALLRGYVAPHILLCGEPDARPYVHLLGRFLTEPPSVTGEIYTRLIEPVRSQYIKALCEAVPQMPLEDVRRRFGFVVTLMASAPLDVFYQSLTGHDPWPNRPQALIEHIVNFCAAGFCAEAAVIVGKTSTRARVKRSRAATKKRKSR